MAPTPPVDRRTVLRGALWAAGAAASGVALSACQAESADPMVDAAPTPQSGAKQRGSDSGSERGSGQRGQQGDRTGRKGQTKPKPSESSSTPDPSAEPTPSGTSANDSGDAGTGGGHQGGDDGRDGGRDTSPGSDNDKPRGNKPDPDPSDDPPDDPGGPPPIVATADVPVGGGVVVPSARVVVTQPAAGAFRCFQNRCTHAGCAVDTVKDGTIHCPCHGSLFAIDSGNPVAGPAPTPLPAVAITVKSGGVFLA